MDILNMSTLGEPGKNIGNFIKSFIAAVVISGEFGSLKPLNISRLSFFRSISEDLIVKMP